MTKGLFTLVAITILATPFITSAHPGNTDSYGCHTCRTNCPKWGLSTGEYHCHNAKSLPQPEAPIRSHYDENGGTTEYWPEYEGSSPSYNPAPSNPAPVAIPTSCATGYTRSKVSGQCITLDQSCVEQVGPSTYREYPNGMGAACNCISGYEWDYKTLHCIKESEVKPPPTPAAVHPAVAAATVEEKSWLRKFLEWLF